MMKKIIMLLAAIVLFMCPAMADTYTINRDKLPEPAREFLTCLLYTSPSPRDTR